jgi:hemolysin III
MAKSSTVTVKPKLRGYIHQEAFFVALGACLLLVLRSTHAATLLASAVYSLSLLTLFGMSAIYHRPTWPPKTRALLKKLDHAAIFIVIAGTLTPICLLGMPDEVGHWLLSWIWGIALLGMLQCVFWINTPKWLTALFYIGMGWVALPYMGEMSHAIGTRGIALLIGGGVAYTSGAICYALRRPNFLPGIFGYHELFHVMTLVGAALHFAIIYPLIV